MGPPTCGIGGTPGVTIGQVCMSVILAAGFMVCQDSLRRRAERRQRPVDELGQPGIEGVGIFRRSEE
jgi:hypothetical protein